MENTVTKEGIEAKIVDKQYLVLNDGRSTLCILTLENGFTVKGFSACVDIVNFDIIIGREIAYEDAFRQIWVLEGYLLAEKLYWDRALPIATNPKKIASQKAIQEINDEFDKEYGLWSASKVDIAKEKSKKIVKNIKLPARQVQLLKYAGVWKESSEKPKKSRLVMSLNRKKTVDAPYGLKKDGTPAKKRGRKTS